MDLTLLLSTVVSAALALITVLRYLSVLLVEGPVLSILSLHVVEVLTLVHLWHIQISSWRKKITTESIFLNFSHVLSV
jgi:hypothetical protein